MAFTNPILAGEELNRTGIRSDNYVPGVSGWRIASNGAAEFDNVGIRGNLWVSSITLNGQDLDTRINNLPKGCIAFIRGNPIVSTTTEQQILFTECDLVQGRFYEIAMTNIGADQGNANKIEYRIRATFDAVSYPTNSSQQMVSSMWMSPFQSCNIRLQVDANYTGKLRLRGSIASLDGATVRSFGPDAGGTIAVFDLGKSPIPLGAVGSTPFGKTLKEWTITANSSKTYHGDGTQRPTDAYQYDMLMGDWNNGRGNQRGWFTFSTADVNTYLNDAIGVSASDVQIAELKLDPFQWRQASGDGYISLGYHNTVNSLAGTTEPGGGIPNVYRPYVAGYGPMWFGLFGGSVPTNFLSSIKDGYLKGFMVGNTFAGAQYCGAIEAVGDSFPPQLHMKYLK